MTLEIVSRPPELTRVTSIRPRPDRIVVEYQPNRDQSEPTNLETWLFSRFLDLEALGAII